MKVSLVVPTYRYGGLDVLFGGLKNQTMKDFEVLLIDDLLDERKDEVKEYAEKLGISLRHMKPKEQEKGIPTGLCNAVNTGLIYADGDYIMFLEDHVWLNPSCLQRHLELQQPVGRVTVGPMHFCNHPPLKDLKGKITVFDKLYEDKPETVRCPDFRMLPNIEGVKEGETYRLNFFLANAPYSLMPNAMFPLQLCVYLNGFDERFDMGHGYGDNNFIFRAQLLKTEFLVDRANEAFHVDHEWSRLTSTPGAESELFMRISARIMQGIEPIRAPNWKDLLQQRVRRINREWCEREGGIEKPVKLSTYQEPCQQQRIKWLIDRCKDATSILEAGCSGGYVLRKVGNEYTIKCGFDINANIIAENKNKFTNIQWEVVDATESWPFTDNQFEVVLLSEILEHVPLRKVWNVIQEAARVAQKKILITLPNATMPYYNRRNVEALKHQWACNWEKLWWISCAFIPHWMQTLYFPFKWQELFTRQHNWNRIGILQDQDFIYIEAIKE